MMTIDELLKIKYGDYLELKQARELVISRVVDVHQHKYFVKENKVTMVALIPVITPVNSIVWTFEMLQTYMNRIIVSPMERKWIKLLYD